MYMVNSCMGPSQPIKSNIDYIRFPNDLKMHNLGILYTLERALGVFLSKNFIEISRLARILNFDIFVELCFFDSNCYNIKLCTRGGPHGRAVKSAVS